jgi:hypothetical protein
MKPSTCTVLVLTALAVPAGAHFLPQALRLGPTARKAGNDDNLKPDPAATRLLANARAMRARWEDFPGFDADVTVNIDGKVSRGTVKVDAKGKVTLELPDQGAKEWATRVLRSTVSHRLDVLPAQDTPCVFGDLDAKKEEERKKKLQDVQKKINALSQALTRLQAQARSVKQRIATLSTQYVAVVQQKGAGSGAAKQLKGKVKALGRELARTNAKSGQERRELANFQDNKKKLQKAPGAPNHPLGRLVRPLRDKFHSSYRIRGRQMTVVNREMPEQGIRFSITVLLQRFNKDKQWLPIDFVVSTWDLKTKALRSSESHHQTWTRVGNFDLPDLTLIVTSGGEDKFEARSIKLTNHQLAKKKKKDDKDDKDDKDEKDEKDEK